MKKIFGIVAVIALAVMILSTGVGCSGGTIDAAPDKNNAPPGDVVVPNLDTVEDFIRNSSTYRFDGVDGSIKLVGFVGDAADVNWDFTIEYRTGHPGHGDRTGYMLAQVVTGHNARITVTSGEITSAVCDNRWDMLKDGPVAAPQPDVQALPGQEFSLPIGQSAAISGEDLVISFIGVTSDSRSPKGAETIWAGEAVCLVQVASQGATSEITLTEKGSTAGFTRVQLLQYNLDFQLQPYPEVEHQPASTDYTLLMKISG